MTDQHLSSLGTLEPKAPYYVFYGTRRQVYWRFNTDGVAFLALWFDITQRDKYTHSTHINQQTDT